MSADMQLPRLSGYTTNYFHNELAPEYLTWLTIELLTVSPATWSRLASP